MKYEKKIILFCPLLPFFSFPLRSLRSLRFKILFFIFAFSACQSAPPTPAVTPTILPLPTAVSLAQLPTLTPTITPDPNYTPPPTLPFTPTPPPAGGLVNPQAILATSTPRPAATSANAPLELVGPVAWRPAPMQVPLSLHPDDHFWFIRPLATGTRNYDLEWYPYGNDVLVAEYYPYRIHHGLDFPNPIGTQIVAAGDGQVVFAGRRASELDGIDYYGNTIIIKHNWQWRGQDVYTLYAHTLEMFVQEGDEVEQGQLIAGVGASGFVSGPHLHFEVRVGENRYTNTQNPLLWMAPYEGWGILAGRFVDEAGEFITNAEVVVVPLDVDTFIRSQRTYLDPAFVPDAVWRENFALELPAGSYQVFLTATFADGLRQSYQRIMTVLPGRTNFMIVQTDFRFVPTAVPPTVSAPITTTIGTETTPTP